MTKIEWTERSWNPIVGCSVVSPGCTHCYAMAMAARIERMGTAPHYAGTTQPSRAGPVWTGKMALAPDRALTAPLLRRKPTTYFVNSMGDLFHEAVPDDWIDRVFAVMALCPQHIFQVLTKRSARMRNYIGALATRARVYDHVCDDAINGAADVILIANPAWADRAPPGRQVFLGEWPLPNVWLGVSTEDQTRADERIPDLLATPAAIRFISAEPLLGPVNFDVPFAGAKVNALNGAMPATPALDWIICGGESGRNARPMHPAWARSLRDQCQAAGVPFFFKQWGDWVSVSEVEGPGDHHRFDDGATVRRTGKKAAGRTLDGREWSEVPL